MRDIKHMFPHAVNFLTEMCFFLLHILIHIDLAAWLVKFADEIISFFRYTTIPLVSIKTSEVFYFILIRSVKSVLDNKRRLDEPKSKTFRLRNKKATGKT